MNVVSKVAVLSAAVGTVVAAPSYAALVSAAPAGFTGITFGSPANSTPAYSFSIDGATPAEFTLSGGNAGFTLTENAATVGASSFIGVLTGTTDPTTLAIGSVKNALSVTVDMTGTFPNGTAAYAALGTNIVGTPFATSGTLGYLEGELNTSDAGSTFTLIDYGLVTSGGGSGVPEPASLALLATGAAGIAAIRRRRAARP